MRTFCTIITPDHWPYAVTLYRSLIRYRDTETLVVLVCGTAGPEKDALLLHNVSVLYLSDISNYGETSLLCEKYGQTDMDAFRWSMKSVLLRYLLENGYEKVIYLDCDIFFFNEYEFLFDELQTTNILLSPSWRTIDPGRNEEEFIRLYTDGLYNAGFIGANQKGIPALQWWTGVCSYRIAIDYENGFFVDQKYLDAMPLMFQNVKMLTHRGCNVSIWNQNECRRVSKNGHVLINGTEQVVFIHFNNNYVKELLKGNDHLLFPYLKQYESAFAESGFSLSGFIQGLPEYKEPGFVSKMKRKILVRTRFKNFMHKLIDKI